MTFKIDPACCPHCGKALRGQPFEVDIASGVARFDASEIRLEPKPSLVLEELSRDMPRGKTRDRLLEVGWGEYVDHLADPTQTLEVCVSRLRRILREAGWPFEIESMRGAGYRLVRRPT